MRNRYVAGVATDNLRRELAGLSEKLAIVVAGWSAQSLVHVKLRL
jgi:hypothetical protein